MILQLSELMISQKKNQVSKNGTVNFSSRINKDIFSILENESMSKNISINSLINNILGRYTELDIHANELGLISLTKRAITSIFQDMKDKEIRRIASEVGGVVHKELVFLKFNELTFENLIHVLIINATRYGSVKHDFENSKHMICIHHGVCEEFSIFLSLIHEMMAHHLSVKITIKNSDQNTLCIEIEEP